MVDLELVRHRLGEEPDYSQAQVVHQQPVEHPPGTDSAHLAFLVFTVVWQSAGQYTQHGDEEDYVDNKAAVDDLEAINNALKNQHIAIVSRLVVKMQFKL